MRLLFLAVILSSLFGISGAHANTNGCREAGGPVWNAAYCGRFSVAGAGGSTGAGNALPCSFFVAATGGSDSNAGTSAAPFATLEKAQTVARGAVSLSKVVCLKAGSGGSFNRTASLNITAADNGDTWQFDPASGVNTAVIDGGGTVNIMELSGVSNFTVNGLKLQHSPVALLHAESTPRSTNVTIENCDLGTVAFAPTSGAIVLDNTTNLTISHNFIHNTGGNGLWVGAFATGDSLDGLNITSNVVLNTIQTTGAQGAIYLTARATGINGGNMAVTNNYIRDYGASSLTADMVCIYLDDNASNVAVTGNICAPPTVGAVNAGNKNNTTAILVNGGVNDTVTGNIIDLGTTSAVITASWSANSGHPAPGVPNGNIGSRFSSNIVLSDFDGAVLNTMDGSLTAFAYYQLPNGPGANYAIANNDYFNYGAGGAVFSNGNITGDGSPSAVDPQCSSGYLYSITTGSPVFGIPVNFPPIVGNWGPPGFVVPTSTNHSCPTPSTPPPTVVAPAQAIAAGFATPDLNENFTDITKSIDLNNTGAPGFTFYVQDAFDSGHTAASNFQQIAGGGVRNIGPGAPNGAAQTWSPTGTTFTRLFGYTEWEAAIENPSSGTSPGWAAMWSLSEKHLAINNLDYYTEDDDMEWFGYPAWTLHDWGNATPTGGHIQSDNNVHPANFDPTVKHLYGHMEQDLGGGNGWLTIWIDNQFQKGIKYGPSIVPFYTDVNGNNIGAVSGAAVGTFKINYTDPVALIFGTGSNMPLDIYYVRHWRH